VCVTVIGWGSIAVAAFVGFCGIMLMVMSVTTPDEVTAQGSSTPSDFVFAHLGIVAGVQMAVAAILAMAGRGLLHSRRWASRVVQVIAWLSLAYMGLGMALFALEWRTAAAESPRSPDVVFVVMAVATSAFVVIFWSTPLILAIRSLRTERVQRSLT